MLIERTSPLADTMMLCCYRRPLPREGVEEAWEEGGRATDNRADSGVGNSGGGGGSGSAAATTHPKRFAQARDPTERPS